MAVLIIEDNPTNALILKRLISRVLDQDIVIEADAVRALQLCHDRCFELLIVDQLLPGMSGLQIVKAVRLIDAYAAVPIVMVTADTDPRLRHEAGAAGVTDFLLKPVDAVGFRNLLQTHMRHHFAQAS